LQFSCAKKTSAVAQDSNVRDNVSARVAKLAIRQRRPTAAAVSDDNGQQQQRPTTTTASGLGLQR